MAHRRVFEEVSGLLTEQRNPRTADLDRIPVRAVLERINAEDRLVAEAVAGEIPWIEQAVERVVAAFRAGGRLIYAGAGTSGRLGVLDAAECPPTFGTPPEMVRGVIAGGLPALTGAIEGAEDRGEEAVAALADLNVGPNDVVLAIAASRRTPYALAALEEGRRRGAATVFLTTNPRASLTVDVDVAICPVVGPEALMGSTRMKSGTAQKLVLNMITTASMVRMGKVYENMMVDLMATSRKLVERSRRTVMIVTGLDYDAAAQAIDAAEGSVKTAIVMTRAGVDLGEARRRLDAADGMVRGAIGENG
ncbi:MAG TPA: N-acetylmuramic acid 6-phosphate etherase [Candidatus Eisenbacteria bacterium]